MNDEQATTLLTQTVSNQELIKQFNAGNFESGIENADEVIQIKNGSSDLVQKSEDVLEIIEVLEKTLAKETEKYEIALSHFDANEYDEAKVQLNDILTDNIEHPIFDSLNENIEKLSVDIESALLVKKKEKEEKEREAEEKKRLNQVLHTKKNQKRKTTKNLKPHMKLKKRKIMGEIGNQEMNMKLI